jgi:bifunctional non-homologous end joining protein LigD
VVVGDDRVPNFAALQDVLSQRQPERLVFFVFDLLHLDGRDFRGVALLEREKALAKLLARQPKGGQVRYADHVVEQGPEFFRHACELGLEGIVSKLADSPYRSERSGLWQKIKCLKREEFVVGGWMASTSMGRELRSLLVGYYQERKLVLQRSIQPW